MKKTLCIIIALMGLCLSATMRAQDLKSMSHDELNLIIFKQNNPNANMEQMAQTFDLVNTELLTHKLNISKATLESYKKEYLQKQFMLDFAEINKLNETLTKEEKITIIELQKDPEYAKALKVLSDQGGVEQQLMPLLATLFDDKPVKAKGNAEYKKLFNEYYAVSGLDATLNQLTSQLSAMQDMGAAGNQMMKSMMEKFTKQLPIVMANLYYDKGLTNEGLKACIKAAKVPAQKKFVECFTKSLADPANLVQDMVTKYMEFLSAKGVQMEQ